MAVVRQASGMSLAVDEVLNVAQVVHSWELPLPIESAHDAVNAVVTHGEEKGFRPEDFALVLEQATEQWRSSGVVAPQLRAAVDAALEFTAPPLDDIDAKAYFDLYKKLRSGGGDVASLTHSTVLRLLSRTSLISHLLGEERFSCSQVSRLLAANETSLDVSYGSIVKIARKLNMLPQLNREEAVDTLWQSDQTRSIALFPDSSLPETNSLAGAALSSWLPEVDAERLLIRLSNSNSPDAPQFWPYLQILHWCLVPIEFFDHPASYLYEFAPRGGNGEALFAKYPAVTGNPFLNNAKAVHSLDSWARGRGGDDAHALAEIVKTVDTLPFVPRRQVARILRAWLVRIIELRTVEPVLLDIQATNAIFESVSGFITSNETYTQGVIEQRVVDCLAVLAYDKPGWRARGLGDGVNATNFSRHKLGDVEFANVDQRCAIALEAHGGHLSLTYVADHARSLARIIDQRLKESWGNLDDPESWTVRVLFVAHSRDVNGLPTEDTLHGVNVRYEYLDYRELVNLSKRSSLPADQIAAFQFYVIEQLNEPTVRESARDKFREIVAITAQ
ncbi:hypothetical protein ACI1US_02078 [Leucobacter sp. BZR 635]